MSRGYGRVMAGVLEVVQGLGRHNYRTLHEVARSVFAVENGERLTAAQVNAVRRAARRLGELGELQLGQSSGWDGRSDRLMLTLSPARPPACAVLIRNWAWEGGQVRTYRAGVGREPLLDLADDLQGENWSGEATPPADRRAVILAAAEKVEAYAAGWPTATCYGPCGKGLHTTCHHTAAAEVALFLCSIADEEAVPA